MAPRSWARIGWLGILALWGCNAPASKTTAAAAKSRPSLVTFRGTCDASGAVALGDKLFALADDENNVLRVYDARRGGDPVYAVDVSPAIGLPMGELRVPEADIEAATRFGQYALWITSHGLNSHGKLQPSRFRFFATTAPAQGSGLAPIGRAYDSLLADMLTTPQLSTFNFELSARLAPKDDGGLNIEGMTRSLDGKSVWIGFRNPRPEGKALLVPLTNPLEVVQGARAEFGMPLLLDLDDLGVRVISVWQNRYLIGAGSSGNERMPARLYAWDGSGQPQRVSIDLQGLNLEAMVSFESEREILLLSDDGTVEMDGVACKSLGDASRKQFRGLWTALP
jgi:hypothetical protein